MNEENKVGKECGNRRINSGRDSDIAALRWTGICTIAIMILCLAGLAIYFYGSSSPWKNFGAGALTLLASIILGAFVGFLFGVPKENNGAAQADSKPGAHANTNLEQISDWLTKIIVGVGLTQLSNAPGFMKKAAAFFSGAFQNCTALDNAQPAGTQLCNAYQSVVMSVMLLGLATGFLAGFLFTRLYLTRAFDKNDDAVNAPPSPDDNVPPTPTPIIVGPDTLEKIETEEPAKDEKETGATKATPENQGAILISEPTLADATRTNAHAMAKPEA